MIVNLIKLSRTKQWIKNFFVFAPLIFSKHIFDLKFLLTSLLAFAIFCISSSAVYVLNDIMDVEADRSHPKKKFRPIASGEISVNTAIIFLLILLVIVAVSCIYMKPVFIFVIFLYIVSNFLYSWKIKSIVLLDVFFISFGFMLRVLGGAAAISVSVSSWMMLTTIFISLFLAVSKRRGELSQVINQDNIEKQRKVLRDYSVEYADQLNTIAAAGTIISYALYTVSERTVLTFGTEKLIYTTPFVIYGIFRYMYLIHQKNLGESPTTIVTKDIPIMLNVFIWFLACVAIIYKARIPFFHEFVKFILPVIENLRKLKAELILLFIAAIWGGTFVITKLSLLELPPFTFLSIRFLLASILFLLIFFRKIQFPKKDELIGGIILGILLFSGFASQTLGLVYTTASKSALITGTNLLIIPFAQYLIIKKKVGLENWISVIVVLMGLYLLTRPESAGINFGDFLTLICAFSWAFYIIYLDIASKKYQLHTLVITQFLLVSVLSFTLSIIFEKLPSLHFSVISITGILYTAILATLIATFLGNKYQKETTPIRAGIIFMFEQPSAVFLAIIFLNESFGLIQILGGVLMLLGILFSESYEYIKR